MSEANKGKYEVIKIIRDNILLGLSTMGLQPKTGSAERPWDVMEFAQASFQNADKIVLINNIRNGRVGWQSTKYGIQGDELSRVERWCEEQKWQIHILFKRDTNVPVTADTLTVEDAASLLITWFNGKGCEEFRRHGCANLIVDPSQIFVYNDDSSIYQRRAVFTVNLQVPKKWTSPEEDLDAIKPDIFPV